MTPEIFAEWLRRQGRTVIKTQSSYWADFGPRVLQAFPYHWVISPSEEELNELLRSSRAVGLRYSAPVDSPEGMYSYHTVYEEKHYLLQDFTSKMRTKVRKGLASVRVENIPLETLAEQGWQLRQETLLRQGRPNAETRSWWRALCLSAKDLQGFEAWGAFDKDELAAAVLVFVCGDTASILYHQSLTRYLRNRVNNALTFIVTNSLLSRQNISRIFYGLHSLDAPSSMDEFKFEMRYTAKPVRQRVVFHPWLRPFMNRASHALLRAGLRLKPAHPILSKAEGMLRFYLQGRLPLEKQSLPPPLQSK